MPGPSGQPWEREEEGERREAREERGRVADLYPKLEELTIDPQVCISIVIGSKGWLVFLKILQSRRTHSFSCRNFRNTSYLVKS